MHLDVDPGPHQRNRRRDPADPAADNHCPQGHALPFSERPTPRTHANPAGHAAMATGFRGVPADVMWMTSMLGYAILAIELSDLDAAAQLLAIIEEMRR